MTKKKLCLHISSLKPSWLKVLPLVGPAVTGTIFGRIIRQKKIYPCAINDLKPHGIYQRCEENYVAILHKFRQTNESDQILIAGGHFCIFPVRKNYKRVWSSSLHFHEVVLRSPKSPARSTWRKL